MNLLSILRFADFIATVAVDSAVLVFALTAYRRTRMKAFAFLFWGSVIGIIMSAGLQMERQATRTTSDALMFYLLYRTAYIAATVLWGTGVILLVRQVLSGFEKEGGSGASASPIGEEESR